MLCIVFMYGDQLRPIMEASSTLENIRSPVVSRLSRKVINCLRLQCQNILLYIFIEVSVDNLEYS